MSGKSVPPPNHTQTPNIYYDEIMPQIDTLAEMKVTEAIIRQTFGWHKEEDRLSLTRLQELTGLSRQSVAEGIKSALKRGYVGRRQEGQGYVYGLRVASQDTRPPDDSTSQASRPVTSQASRHTKERSKESVSANAESAKASPKAQSVVGLEKHIVDEIYQAMKEAGFRLPNEHFKYHLGRAKDVLEKDDPTDAEIEAIPSAFVGLWTIKGKADCHSALMEHRRQKKRPDLVSVSGPAPWEPKNPHSPKPQTLSDDELARRRAEREELGRMMAEARAKDG